MEELREEFKDFTETLDEVAAAREGLICPCCDDLTVEPDPGNVEARGGIFYFFLQELGSGRGDIHVFELNARAEMTGRICRGEAADAVLPEKALVLKHFEDLARGGGLPEIPSIGAIRHGAPYCRECGEVAHSIISAADYEEEVDREEAAEQELPENFVHPADSNLTGTGSIPEVWEVESLEEEFPLLTFFARLRGKGGGFMNCPECGTGGRFNFLFYDPFTEDVEAIEMDAWGDLTGCLRRGEAAQRVPARPEKDMRKWVDREVLENEPIPPGGNGALPAGIGTSTYCSECGMEPN